MHGICKLKELPLILIISVETVRSFRDKIYVYFYTHAEDW